ncbi:hypothetical protein GCM10022223_11020 [Kineosporia mesophila]|uniref:O-antigen/teichoic acid export membrane protein n=1 Tax=Kineosporia mesophila TaxID=566012 RepID=A0ABP6Z5N0_9ACTN|nr:hypothetical protein [Kineosporia mesophila]MCD5352580.1 hypothetical protein [Kineosporia mesophila]
MTTSITRDGPVTDGQTPAGGLRRIAAISASLVSTQAATSVLGLAFWSLAARQFSVAAVGVGGAAVSLMTLLGTLGSLGLGTLLIARLPHTDQGSRRVLVRTALTVAAGATAVLALAAPWVAIHLFGLSNLTAVAGSPERAVIFSIGTALTAVAIVLDQAVLVIGTGALQLERNVIASSAKLLALLALSAGGQTDGMTIFIAWLLGTLVSFPAVAWRTRGGRALENRNRLVDLSSLRGLGRAAAGHHALNTTLMSTLMLLPLIVTVSVSPAANGVFNTALQVSGFVFALPYAVAVGLFAAAEGDQRQVLARMRFTVPFGLGAALLANLALFPLAPLVLAVFGATYAEQGTTVLRILVLAGLPFVVKDHYVALRRVQGRTAGATAALLGFTVVELVAARIGAQVGGTVGLCAFWVSALMIEALVLAVPLFRARRAMSDPGGSAGPGLSDPRRSVPRLRARHARSRTVSSTVSQGEPPELMDPSVTSAPAADISARKGRPAVFADRVGIGPVLLLMSLGLLSIAHAVSLARGSTEHATAAQAWYVAGLVTIFAPAAFGVLVPGLSRFHRVVLAVAMPVLLQLSRVVLYPTRFMFHDELLHANLLREISSTGRLFTPNPLLPITSYYPGLEIATDGLHDLTGLSAHTSAAVVLVVTRIVMALSVLAIVERVTGSTRVGAVAGVVYACNPQLLFFNSQFSYQTLALPLAVLTVYLVISRRRGTRLSLILPLMTMAAVSVTHHVTAGLLMISFVIWWSLELVLRRKHENEATALAVLAGSGAALLAATVLNPGNTLGSYLGAIVESSGTALTSFVEGKQSKQLFQNSAGVGTAAWEQVAVIASLAITLLALIPAIIRARAWVRARYTAAVLFCLVALIYPVIPGGHLTRTTAEVGDRAAGFVFLGVGFVVAWWLCRRRIKVWHAAAFSVAASVTFVGGVVLGAGPTSQQLPGPFEIAADARSMDPANLSAAAWISANLPAGSRAYADRDSGLLAAADGGLYVVRHISTNIDASRLLLDPEFTTADRTLIRQAGIRYLIADRRDAFGLPNQGVYIESGEFGELGRTAPVPAQALSKFDAVRGVDRIYDNGAIAIYDLGALDD